MVIKSKIKKYAIKKKGPTNQTSASQQIKL